jgi:hypothetical protein
LCCKNGYFGAQLGGLEIGSKREPVTFQEKLLAALDRVEKAERVFFVPLGEGFYVYVLPPIYDLAQERERFDRDAEQARRAVMGDAALGRYTLINFRDVREARALFSDDYQQWGGKHAIQLTGEVGLIFLVREQEVRQVIAQECARLGLACEPHEPWNMRVGTRTLFTGDLIYEAIGRAVNFSQLVREQLKV